VRSIGVFAVVLSLTLAASFAQATNGYFAHGYGTKNKGMAGAGVALPQDALAAAVNPAGTLHVGRRIDAGVALFSPPREYTQKATTSGNPPNPPLPIGSQANFTGTVESGNDYFLVPHFGYARPLGSDQALGIAVYGNGGMNTRYEASDTTGGVGTFGGGNSGLDLSQLFVNLNYARRVGDGLTLGVAGIVAVQSFEARGLGALGDLVADGNAESLTDNGHELSYGAGAQFGLLWQAADRLSIGASYQTKLNMTAFDDYSDLFAEQGAFDIPPTAAIGLAFAATDRVTLVADVQKIWYGDIPSLANPMSDNLAQCIASNTSYCLGGDNGAGFGWDDVTVYKLGAQWDLRPDWSLRVGFSTAKQPVPTSGVLFNVLAPAVAEDHYTLGLTKRLEDDNELNLSVMYAPRNDLDCGCSLPFTGGPQSINIAMEQWEVELSYAWRF
jgi:long-chain fatty acid transport protein